jgi:hypothetical protein
LTAALSAEKQAAAHVASPTVEAPVGRVIVVRHGMGFHNDAYVLYVKFAKNKGMV